MEREREERKHLRVRMFVCVCACMQRIRATPQRVCVSDLIDASSHIHMQGNKVITAATVPMPDPLTPMLGDRIFTRQRLKTHLRLDSLVRVRVFTREVCLVDEPPKLPPRRGVLALHTRHSRVSSRTRIFFFGRRVRPLCCNFVLAAVPAGKQGPLCDG